MARNTVEVVVKSKDEAKPDLAELKAKLGELGRTVESARVGVDDKDSLAKLAALQLRLDAVGRRIENPKINAVGAQRAEAEVLKLDAALSHIGEKSVPAAQASGENAGKGFMSKFASFVTPGKFQLLASGVASGLAALPALAAGAGVLAGTAFAAKFLVGTKKMPGPLYDQFKDMTSKIQGVLQSAMRPMLGPLRQAFTSIGDFAKQIGPQLHAVFGAIGPLVMPLVHGLETLVRGVLPGFVALMKAAAPAVQVIAQLMGSLGKDLGGMFASFAPAVAASAKVLAAIGTVLNGILPVVGRLAASLAGALSPVLLSIGQALHALAPAFAVVLGVLGKLAGAVLSSLSGALQTVAQLVAHLAPTFKLLGAVMGHVFNLMENSGVFGVLEDSLEKLAKPLADLINALAQSLVPVLPPLIQAVTQFSTILSGGLATALADIATALTAVIRFFPPLVPMILGIVGAIKLWSVAQGILDAVLEANPIGLIITAIGLLVVAIVEVVKHWHTIASVVSRVWHVIASAVSAGVSAVVGFFERLWHDGEHNLQALISFAESLPHRILSALASFGRLLWNTGVNLLMGLIHGIESVVGDVIKTVEGVGASILHGIKSALGISSPSRHTREHGRQLGAGLIAGMQDMHGPVKAAAARLAQAAIPPGHAYGGALGGYGHRGGRGGAQVVLRMEPSHGGSGLDELFWRWFREHVRAEGGDVQKALGWG